MLSLLNLSATVQDAPDPHIPFEHTLVEEAHLQTSSATASIAFRILGLSHAGLSFSKDDLRLFIPSSELWKLAETIDPRYSLLPPPQPTTP